MIAPPFLKKGDKVALVAPAKYLEPEALENAIKATRQLGYDVVEGKTLYLKHFQVAGNDNERASDLQYFMDNPDIKAIFCLRGGFGTYRLLPKLSFSGIMRYPKWVIGFSDITFLHTTLNKKGLCSMHASMPLNYAAHGLHHKPVTNLAGMLEGNPVKYEIPNHALNRPGNTEGRITGGNLSVLYGLQGTPYEMITTNRVLFLEDLNENLYHIDRMMTNLKLSGKLDRLKGLVVGAFTDIKDDKSTYGMDAYEIIREKVEEYQYPVIFDFPAGHIKNNMPICLGGTVKIDAKSITTQVF